MSKSISIFNKIYEIDSFTGEVMDSSRQREVRVTGSGGGGATWDGYGGTAPINITSETIVHDEFFLLNEQGKEKDFHLTNWKMPLRVGHKVQIIWIYPPNDNTGWYVVMNNHNLEKVEWNEDKLNDIAKAHYRLLLWGAWIASVFVAYVFSSSGFFIILAIAAYIFYRIKTKAVYQALYDEISRQID